MKTLFRSILLFAIPALIFLSCNKDEEPQPPFASFTINPEEGLVGTEFTFNASGSYNSSGDCSSLQYKWDWEGDGNWDTEYSDDKTEKHTFSDAGDYKPTLEIKDCSGWTNFVVKDLTVHADTTSSK